MNQKGFTMIELVVVIVILGILAAVAVPRFVSLQDEAEVAAADGIKGSIDSASAINYAAYLGSGGTKGVAIGASGTATICSQAITAVLTEVDAGITNTDATALVGTPGTAVDCDISYEGEARVVKMILTVN